MPLVLYVISVCVSSRVVFQVTGLGISLVSSVADACA